MSTWSNLNFQNSNSPLMEQLLFFHDSMMIIITLITSFVLYLMISIWMNKLSNYNLLENQNIELIWTTLPSMFLIMIAMPSLHLLYLMDESQHSNITLKIIGHQWYWSYEYSDFMPIEFDSYMTPINNNSSFRLLDTDNRIVLPFNTQIRTLITSSDTIHAWTIPSLGVKADALPGRLNQTSMFINRPGMFFGQCSEICGTNHSFMPISLEIINMTNFIKWIKNFN
uniref:cytochrome c oxidase subunit II n=1 Tax=Arctopsyche spinescens TaxID=2973067 RepID=UPI00223817C8|nr:cytochrome c oxidase subunit II [Arctopsyche spinescens]UYO79359.1 cytochrome c oxidase subunit II [Arctopsyche spinescens]